MLIFLPCLNILNLTTNQQEFYLKLIENKMAPFEAPKDIDAYRMESIEVDFRIYTCQVILRISHFVTLLYLRGWNLNLFDFFFLGKATTQSLTKMLSDFATYLEYRSFLTKLDGLMITKEFSSGSEEICPICQDLMQSGRQLVKCPHVYHQYCIVKFIQKGGDKCPMCR